MIEFLTHLLSSQGFEPHGHCYLWLPEILWLHVISDAFIALAYYSIPIALIYRCSCLLLESMRPA